MIEKTRESGGPRRAGFKAGRADAGVLAEMIGHEALLVTPLQAVGVPLYHPCLRQEGG
jgi:hypothetical protein